MGKGKVLRFFKYVFLLFLLISIISYAQSNKLSIKVEGFLVRIIKENNKTKEILKPLPKEVFPNNIIEYHIIVENTSNENIKNVKIIGKIPKGTLYIENSATDSPQFSIDGGKTFHRPPIKYTVIENGKKVEKIATSDMYTNLLWTVKQVQPKEKIIFKYRVNVK